MDKAPVYGTGDSRFDPSHLQRFFVTKYTYKIFAKFFQD